jgi:hypothetical protein
VRKLLPLLFVLFALALAGCYMPPYQEELSLATVTADKLEGRTVIGPLDRGPYDFRDMDVRFYPSKDDLNAGSEFIRGFVVGVGKYSARIISVEHSGVSGDDYYVNGERTESVENADPDLFNHSFFSVKEDGSAGGTEYLGFVRFDYSEGIRDFLLFDEFFSLLPGPDPIDLNEDVEAGTIALGASVFPENSTSSDLFHILNVDPASGLYSEWSCQTDSSAGLLSYTEFRPDFTISGKLPANLRGAFYFSSPVSLSPTRRSYLSVYDPVRRGYRNFSWDDNLQLKVLAEMKGCRIDLLLSNGWLFGRDENRGYVYDSKGELLNDFALGGLNLVYEIVAGTKAEVIFTIASWAPQDVGLGGNDGDDRLYCVVYRLPTNQLDDL